MAGPSSVPFPTANARVRFQSLGNDVAKLVTALNLKSAIYIGHSTGGGEVAHYVARTGWPRLCWSTRRQR